MKATEYKIELLVTAELVVTGENRPEQLASLIVEMQDRIKEQLAGHRTSKRLADHVRVVFTGITAEYSREIE